MNQFNFPTYFENIARSHPDIAHDPDNDRTSFHKSPGFRQTGDMMARSHSITGAQLVIHDVMSGTFSDDNDNFLDRPNYSFIVLYPGDRDEALDNAKRIIRDIIGRMIYHSRNEGHLNQPSYGLRYLNSIKYFTVGPFGANNSFWGIEVSFSIQQPAKSIYNPNIWLPNT